METFLLLLLLKVRYPTGSHSFEGTTSRARSPRCTASTTSVSASTGASNVWRYCCDVFDYLSLGAVVDGRVSFASMVA